MAITIHVIASATAANAKTPLTVEPADSIAQIKESIKKSLFSEDPDVQMRLIFAGRILKDADTVEGSKLAEGSTVHVVRLGGAPKKEPVAAPAAANVVPAAALLRGAPLGGAPPVPGAMGNATSTAAAASNPFAAALAAMGTQQGGQQQPAMPQMNPEMMRASMEFMMANPQLLQSILAADPRFASMPAEVRAMMSNPEVLRSIMSMPGFGEGMPGGDEADFAAMSGMGVHPDLLPTASTTETSNVPPAERFRPQLQQLQDMGFWDQEENVRVLLECRGNVNAAIERLLQRM